MIIEWTDVDEDCSLCGDGPSFTEIPDMDIFVCKECSKTMYKELKAIFKDHDE